MAPTSGVPSTGNPFLAGDWPPTCRHCPGSRAGSCRLRQAHEVHPPQAYGLRDAPLPTFWTSSPGSNVTEGRGTAPRSGGIWPLVKRRVPRLRNVRLRPARPGRDARLGRSERRCCPPTGSTRHACGPRAASAWAGGPADDHIGAAQRHTPSRGSLPRAPKLNLADLCPLGSDEGDPCALARGRLAGDSTSAGLTAAKAFDAGAAATSMATTAMTERARYRTATFPGRRVAQAIRR